MLILMHPHPKSGRVASVLVHVSVPVMMSRRMLAVMVVMVCLSVVVVCVACASRSRTVTKTVSAVSSLVGAVIEFSGNACEAADNLRHSVQRENAASAVSEECPRCAAVKAGSDFGSACERGVLRGAECLPGDLLGALATDGRAIGENGDPADVGPAAFLAASFAFAVENLRDGGLRRCHALTVLPARGSSKSLRRNSQKIFFGYPA